MKETTKEKEEVLEQFKESQVVYLATSKDSQPGLRPVTLLYLKNEFWVATGTSSAKVLEIHENPQIEFCLPLKNEKGEGYVRASGQGTIITDESVKKYFAENCSFFSNYWEGPQDPNFTLIQLKINEFEYLKPGEFQAHKIAVQERV